LKEPTGHRRSNGVVLNVFLGSWVDFKAFQVVLGGFGYTSRKFWPFSGFFGPKWAKNTCFLAFFGRKMTHRIFFSEFRALRHLPFCCYGVDTQHIQFLAKITRFLQKRQKFTIFKFRQKVSKKQQKSGF
jgi:hypothetical protein